MRSSCRRGRLRPDSAETNQDELSQEEILRLPVYVLHRPKKDPREIKVLDPACGSGHFLLYCFDLLLVIYEEAYDDPDLGPSLQADYPTKEDLRRELPGLILRHNLHGIDIDLRAVQIAGLALWLRCQRAYQEMGLKKNRPPITKSNVVCAEPMPGEKELLDEFLKTLRDDHLEALIRQVTQVPEGTRVRATKAMADSLSDLVRTVWEKMRLAGEAGSLLKIEEELQDAIRKGQDEWEERLPLFRFTEYGLSEVPKERLLRFVPGDVEGERTTFWDRAESLVRKALDEFVEFASNGGRFQRRLFVEDAEQGLGFVDVCRQRFEAVLMNPPFGRIIPISYYKRMMERYYPDSWTDYFLAFIDRARNLASARGMAGAVIPNRLLDAKKARETRKTLSTNWTASLLVEFGRDVMDDAAVDAILLVAPSSVSGSDSCFFLDAQSIAPVEREDYLARWADQPHGLRSLSIFRQIPGTPFAYRKPQEILQLWEDSHRLDPDLASVATGGKTFDDERFLRLRWEVPPSSLGDRWLSVDTGGDYQPWVSPPVFTEDWQNEGKLVRDRAIARYGTDAQVMQSSKFWFKPGLAYPYTSSIGFGPRIFPAGTILSTDAIAISPKDGTDPLVLLGAIASSWAGELLTIFGDHRKTENSSVKSLPFDIDRVGKSVVRQLAESAVGHLLRFETYREVSPYFLRPPMPGELSEIAER